MSAPRLAASAVALACGGVCVVIAGTRPGGVAAVVLVVTGVLLGAIGSRFVPLLFVPGLALVVGDLAVALLRHDVGPWRALLGAGACYGYAELSWLARGRQRRGRPRDLDANLSYLGRAVSALALGSALGATVIALRGGLAGLPASPGRAVGGVAAALLVAIVVWRRRGAPRDGGPPGHARATVPPSPRGPDGG